MLRNGEAADPPAFVTEQADWNPGDVDGGTARRVATAASPRPLLALRAASCSFTAVRGVRLAAGLLSFSQAGGRDCPDWPRASRRLTEGRRRGLVARSSEKHRWRPALPPMSRWSRRARFRNKRNEPKEDRDDPEHGDT